MKAMKNLMLASLLIGLGACSNYEQDVLDASKYITVDAGFGTDSRVATTGLASVFQVDDAIGVYAWTGGKTLPSSEGNFQVYNVANTYDGTNWTAAENMWWKDDTSHYFLSVYPATDILTTTTYTLNPNDQVQSDLLIATNFGENNEGIAPQSNPVPLAFGHVMAKLRVNIMFNDELSDPSLSVSEVIAKAKQTATIDWQNATAEATGDTTGIKLPPLATPAQGYAYSYESVMVPQDGFQCVDVKIGNQTYTFNDNKDIPLIKGKITTLNLIVGRSSVVVGDPTIDEWTLYGVVDGTKSIRFIPEYSDGKVELTSNVPVTLKFMVSPAAAAKSVAQAYTDNNTVVTAFISRTKSRADATVDPTAINVTAVEGTEAGILTVAVNTENLPADYWADAEDANLFIRISDGNNDVISEMIPTTYMPYLTFTVDGEQSLVLNVKGELDSSIEYSADGEAWTNFVVGGVATPLVSFTNNLRMRGKSESGTSAYFTISFKDNNTPVTCSGDIRTLVDYTNYETTSTEKACFLGLFEYCSALADASGLKLISNNNKMAASCYESMFSVCTSLTSAPALPAKTLAASCYKSMFANCSNLESAPALPATTLAKDCYASMFSGCSSLRTAPALPAEKLADNCYDNMFVGCWRLTTAPELPATTLAVECYDFMFSHCTGLTSAPELPATALANNCYSNMFLGCTSLTSAPALPATALANNCYSNMFNGCTSLTSAPALPATALANYCYYGMFRGCISLTSAPALPATALASNCYAYMFKGCTSLAEAPVLPATVLANSCYSSMFSETALTSAPALPAKSLAEYCYQSMFLDCTSLNSVTMLATNIVASKCLENWLNNVSSTGTFTKAAGITLPEGVSGIPKGWTVKDASSTSLNNFGFGGNLTPSDN